jgi:hypothetical protein
MINKTQKAKSDNTISQELNLITLGNNLRVTAHDLISTRLGIDIVTLNYLPKPVKYRKEKQKTSRLFLPLVIPALMPI